MDNYLIQMSKLLCAALKKLKFKKKVKKVVEHAYPKRSSFNSIMNSYATGRDPVYKYDHSLDIDRSDAINYSIYSSGSGIEPIKSSGTEVIKFPRNVYGMMTQKEIEDFLEKEISRIGHIVFKKES